MQSPCYLRANNYIRVLAPSPPRHTGLCARDDLCYFWALSAASPGVSFPRGFQKRPNDLTRCLSAGILPNLFGVVAKKFFVGIAACNVNQCVTNSRPTVERRDFSRSRRGRAQEVAAADYVSTCSSLPLPGTSLSTISLLKLASEIAHQEYGRSTVI